MPARSPDAVHPQWAAALNAGDLETMLSLYDPEATVVAQPGQVVTGLEQIRAALSGFVAIKAQIEISVHTVLQSGDTALILSPWTLKGTAADGSPIAMAGTTTDVVRRGPDGAWRFIIDNPFGTP